MAISFVGHSPTFENWVFNVNGKELVARNYSTQSPLQLRFEGHWDKPTFTPINTSGFNITDSTDTNMIWQWAGKQYTSSWNAKYDEDDPESKVFLNFGPPVPYTGPARAPVGNEVKVSNKSKEDREASTAYQTYGYTQPVPAPRAPAPSPPTPPTPVGIVTSPVIIPGTKDAREAAEAAAAAGPDWVKLGLQLGAAYLLLS